ncbi:MAG: hypothetical protein RRY22_04110 [Bacilli bacterium]
MAMKYSKIPESTFKNLQVNAGMLLSKFDPKGVTAIVDADIISATKGGIEVSCVPSFKDMGEEIDNAPKNTADLKKIESWECKMSVTTVGMTLATINLALGAGDITTADKVARPRNILKLTDFKDMWFVGDRADGGMVAVCLKNSLSTGGFSFKTTDKGNGELKLELTGHVTLAAQDVVPIEFYIADGPATV